MGAATIEIVGTRDRVTEYRGAFELGGLAGALLKADGRGTAHVPLGTKRVASSLLALTTRIGSVRERVEYQGRRIDFENTIHGLRREDVMLKNLPAGALARGLHLGDSDESLVSPRSAQ